MERTALRSGDQNQLIEQFENLALGGVGRDVEAGQVDQDGVDGTLPLGGLDQTAQQRRKLGGLLQLMNDR
jgi:hypothetical protein